MHASIPRSMSMWLICSWFFALTCSDTGMVILPCFDVYPMYDCYLIPEWPIGLQFCLYLSFYGQPTEECSSFRVISITFSVVMQSGMSAHDSVAVMVKHMPGISLFLFFHGCVFIANLLWIVCGPCLYSIMMLSWWIHSSILWNYLIGLQHLSWILQPVAFGLWSYLPHGQSSSGEFFLGHVVCLSHPFLCCYLY